MFVSSTCVNLKKRQSSVRICRCTPFTNSVRACAASAHKAILPVESKESPSPPSQSAPGALNRDVEAEAREILEWASLSKYVSRLARTDGGRVLLENGMGDNQGLEIGFNRARCEELLEETREMVRLAHELAREVPLTGASEVSGVARDAAKGRVLSGRELRKIASTLLAARKTRRVFEAANSDTDGGFPRLLSHASAARTWPDIEASILEKVDEFGDVTDVADPQLASARSERREVIDSIRSKLRDLMATHSEAIQDRNITMRYDRMCIPVKMTRKSVFRGGTVHDVSATGVTAYIEPASVRKLNDRIRACSSKEKSRVQVVLRALSETVGTIEEDILALCEGLSAIDAAGARAEASIAIGGVDVRFAEMGDDRKLELRGLQHPLLLWQAKEKAEFAKENNWKEKVIPSDYFLPPLVRCAILSGSNTGGKTLALKTLGLTSLMAKSGLFVPAAKVEGGFITLPFFDKILLDAGDDQSIVQSLSTFSGHLERIKRILNATTPQSLVLLDEVGSGTDPQEGAALGAAILRSIAVERRAALTMATTHHGELKTLKYTEGIGEFFENVCVEFDDIAMKPTYRLLWGIPGRSNALAIASRLGLASDIIDDARSMLAAGSDVSNVDFEEMIRNLELQRREADEAAQSAQEARSEAAKEDLHKQLLQLPRNWVALNKRYRKPDLLGKTTSKLIQVKDPREFL